MTFIHLLINYDNESWQRTMDNKNKNRVTKFVSNVLKSFKCRLDCDTTFLLLRCSRGIKQCMDFISWVLLRLCIFYCEMGAIISPLILRGLKEVNMLYITLCKYYIRLLKSLATLSLLLL